MTRFLRNTIVNLLCFRSNEKENLVVTNLSFNILIILVFLQASLNKFLELVLKLVTSHKFKTNKLNENFKKNSMTFLRVFTNVIKVMPKKIPETETLDSIQNVHSPSSVTVDSLTEEMFTSTILLCYRQKSEANLGR
ncbi:uncharacterized protein LOC113468036 [Diaphorina citri]|uniref:Uncharacterized protein LOC113468036 n=1 Tax=Diaphorina citri TaxID=121845 RepID=A0A3Q0J189_DIACI|nr:uncharacterized protein LOC113468036 [Diaphorina citri]